MGIVIEVEPEMVKALEHIDKVQRAEPLPETFFGIKFVPHTRYSGITRRKCQKCPHCHKEIEVKDA